MAIKKSKTLDSLMNITHGISDQHIVLEGVNTHNLKDINVTLPKNKVITITGVSGSGKSSLAFHTIYKEGQYRYIESLSSYLRQFFNLGSRPDIEYSAGLSPAIAIEQNKHIGNSRSTVGTLTEVDDYLRLLFAKVGEIYSYKTGKRIKAQNVETILETIKKVYDMQRVYLLQQLNIISDVKELANFVKKNRNKVEREKGFTRYLLVANNDKKMDPIEYFYLEDPVVKGDFFPIQLYGIYDRIIVEDHKIERLKEDIIKILGESKKFGLRAEGTHDIVRYTDKIYDPEGDIEYPEFTPRHFSANRSEGACPGCSGIGEILQVDMDKTLDPNAPYMRAVLPWRDSPYGQSILKKLAQKYSMDETKLRHEQPEWFRVVVIDGDNELLRVQSSGKYISITYNGIRSIIKEQYLKGMLTVDFQAMLSMEVCSECTGAKLRKESLHVFLPLPTKKLDKETTILLEEKRNYEEIVVTENKGTTLVNIAQMQHLPISALMGILTVYQETTHEAEVLIKRILTPLRDRVHTIDHLGLGYLALHRQVGTLSGGEIQRLRLTKQLGNKLTGIIYVLDEPTIGLDKKEIAKVIDAIRKLQQMGNTIVVVEHNDAFIKTSDWIVEIGPGAGDFGGHVVFNGTYTDFLKQDSLTAKYIRGDLKLDPIFTHKPSTNLVQIKKAHKYNLKNIDVDIALGSFTIITGGSGAGKTTLMYTTLFRFLEEKEKFIQSHIRLQLLKKGFSWQEIISAPVMKREEYATHVQHALQAFHEDLAIDTIIGHEMIDNTLYVDQTSIGKTPRSCPATFVGLFDDIRTLYAGTNEAKYLGFGAGHFSFNSDKGRCLECDGYGYKKIELQFLPDTYIPCELCKGSRYKPEVNGISWKGKSIADILNMYIHDACDFFHELDHLRRPLELMQDIGLGYLKLGQPAQMLSGGESQRLKLVKHFLKSYRGHTVYFLDEPTVGLHPDDINKLLRVIQKFLDRGDTILMIEHDESLLAHADKVIRLDNGKLV